MFASSIFVIELPVPSASIVLLVKVVVDDAVTSPFASSCVCISEVTPSSLWNSALLTEPSAIFAASIAADDFILASSMFVIELPVPSASIVL